MTRAAVEGGELRRSRVGMFDPAWMMMLPHDRLKAAAAIIESVVYDVAGDVSASKVTQLVLLAANVDKIGEELGKAPVRASNDG